MTTTDDIHKNITQKIIPWIKLGRANILVMPCPVTDLPREVEIEKRPVRGARRPLKYYRSGGQISVNKALWPEAGLCEKGEPFFLWVLEGRAEIQIGSQLLKCGPTTAILVPAGVPHPDGSRGHVAPTETGVCSVLLMRQCGRGFRVWISHSRNGQNGHAPRSVAGESMYLPQEKIVHLFKILCEELQMPDFKETSEHALVLFFLLLQRELAARRAFNIAIHNDTRKGREDFEHQQHPIEEACTYIQSHLSAPLTLEGVAGVVHMSRATFARQFREYSGSTFLEYVQKYRLEQAQVFLHETDWTVRTISKLSGFASDSAFNNFFKKSTGKTPLQYRKRAMERFLNNEMIE